MSPSWRSTVFPSIEHSEDLDVSIYAVAVPHGMMPSVAFRVDCGAESVVFSGDISASTASFIALAKNCSMLVHDFAFARG